MGIFHSSCCSNFQHKLAQLTVLSFECFLPLVSMSPYSFVFPPPFRPASQSFAGSSSSTQLSMWGSWSLAPGPPSLFTPQARHRLCQWHPWLYPVYQWFSQSRLPSEPQGMSRCLSVSKVSRIQTELLQPWPSISAPLSVIDYKNQWLATFATVRQTRNRLHSSTLQAIPLRFPAWCSSLHLLPKSTSPEPTAALAFQADILYALSPPFGFSILKPKWRWWNAKRVIFLLNVARCFWWLVKPSTQPCAIWLRTSLPSHLPTSHSAQQHTGLSVPPELHAPSHPRAFVQADPSAHPSPFM